MNTPPIVMGLATTANTVLLDPSYCKEYILDSVYTLVQGEPKRLARPYPLLIIAGRKGTTWAAPTLQYLHAWENRLGFPPSRLGRWRNQQAFAPYGTSYLFLPANPWCRCPILLSAYTLFLRTGLLWKNSDTLETYLAPFYTLDNNRPYDANISIHLAAKPRLTRMLKGDSAFKQTWAGVSAPYVHGAGVANGHEIV